MKRLLEALDCPFAAALPAIETLKVKDCIIIVRWLEDRVIRELDISERDQLRHCHPDCHANISNYLTRLGCPYPWTAHSLLDICHDNLGALNWLGSHAIGLKYEDEFPIDSSSAIDTDEPLTSDDCLEIKLKIDDIGCLMKVLRKDAESNTGCQITFLALLLRSLRITGYVDYLRRLVMQIKCSLLPQEGSIQPFTLDDFPLGFDTGGASYLLIVVMHGSFMISVIDYTVNLIAKVLRMLYLSDFRELQDRVNDLLVLCQDHTANPSVVFFCCFDRDLYGLI
jgi:hypothetical protein